MNLKVFVLLIFAVAFVKSHELVKAEDFGSSPITGYFHVKNFSIHGAEISFDYEFFFELKVSVFHHHEDLKVGPLKGHFAHNFTTACYTVYSIAIAEVKICVDLKNKAVCAEPCIGKWGIEKCAKFCYHWK